MAAGCDCCLELLTPRATPAAAFSASSGDSMPVQRSMSCGPPLPHCRPFAPDSPRAVAHSFRTREPKYFELPLGGGWRATELADERTRTA